MPQHVMNHNHPIIDTHAHLCDSVFDPDLEEVLQNVRSAGVMAVICVGEDMSDAEKNLALASKGMGSSLLLTHVMRKTKIVRWPDH